MLERAKETVFFHVGQDLQKYITSRFQTYFDRLDNFRDSPTLIHADLSSDHFLIDPKERKLTGIFDFGDLQISDPDYEYTYIFEDCGEDIACCVMELREADHIEQRLKKVSFFVTADHLATILAGIDRKDQIWIEEGIEALRLQKHRSLLTVPSHQLKTAPL